MNSEALAKWLCRGGPCLEAGDRCKVLSEDCCPCVLAGNLLERQRDEIERLPDDYETQLEFAQAENKRLTVEIDRGIRWLEMANDGWADCLTTGEAEIEHLLMLGKIQADRLNEALVFIERQAKRIDELGAAIVERTATIARLEAGQSATASLERWRNE